ncbi:MAG: hypothetical protein HON65_09995 [Rhodospirillales bacterium]|nr:hypothetical protein [Rhodospirillales bacterium]
MTKKHTNVGSNSFPCIQQAKSDLRARKWGLLTFANPRQDTPPLWHPDMRDTTIPAETTDTGKAPLISMLRNVDTVVQSLCLLDERQCLKITSNTSEVQLIFPPGTTLDEHSNVSLNLSFDLDLPSQIKKVKTLWDISHGKAKKMSAITS